MYRFTVSGNRSDHKPIVVIAIIFSVLSILLLHTLLAKVFACFCVAISCYFIIQKIHSLQPIMATLLLTQNQLSCYTDKLTIQGNISRKTFMLGDTIYLCITGLNQRYWLVLAMHSIDKQSLARLKRAILSVKEDAQAVK